MLEPDLWPCRSSVSLYEKKELVLVSHQKAEHCQTRRLSQEQKYVQLSMETGSMDHFQAHLSK